MRDGVREKGVIWGEGKRGVGGREGGTKGRPDTIKLCSAVLRRPTHCSQPV